MLFTVVYRSRLRGAITHIQLSELDRRARERNEALGVTGVLLFDGSHFFQLLEGPETAVQDTYARIVEDSRHQHVVYLLKDYAPARKFSQWGMKLFDVRDQTAAETEALVHRLVAGISLSEADRAFKLILAFVTGRWRDHAAEADDAAKWTLETRSSGFADAQIAAAGSVPCQFALQPIVSTATESISSLEALIRSPTGGSPQECFDRVPRDRLHLFDLESKRQAFELAAAIGLGTCKLSVNLLPASLTGIPGAVQRLVRLVEEQGLHPRQIVIEVTEEEAITHFDSFAKALVQLRVAGFSVAIDDFGAGFAGLSLLSRFQPEKLKIDRAIVTEIHRDGPRQAIVKAVVECCRSLGITTIAEGVETIDEWRWLNAVGIDLFQGFLFARPKLNGVPDVSWPIAR